MARSSDPLVIRTTLSVQECAEVFRMVGNELNAGFKGWLHGRAARKRTRTVDVAQGFYTPNDTDAFGQFNQVPDFTVGVRRLRASAAGGAGSMIDEVEMEVYDEGERRALLLVAACPGMVRGVNVETQLLNRFQAAFAAADPTATKH